ncbi:MAG: hypothetical protein FGM40_05635 [Rhodocyclaceae bacterium]|nr:hypothetical protein [Rhodocyclaceae bacterium]
MKILLVLAHFYRPQAQSIYSSTDPGGRDRRRQNLEDVLLDWRSHYSETATINIEHRKCEIFGTQRFQLDIRLVINGSHHLLDRKLLAAYGARAIDVSVEDPRMLPFAAHRVMADAAAAYDWFVYSEDDLVLRNADFFLRQAWFRQTFGPMRLLQPNRYEVNPGGTRFKTYIDGDLKRRLTAGYFERIPGELRLEAPWPGRTLQFARALNPHSGFFAITREELAYWMAQPHFLDLDSSFIGPMESAASLAMLKTFPVYKASGDSQDFCEIRHLDRKFSGLRLPEITI